MDPENETRINGSDGGEEGDGGMEESMAIPPPPPPPIPAEEGGGEVTGHDGSKSVNRIEFDLTAQLQDFEEIYLSECAKERPAPEAKFNYAWALIRSSNPVCIQKGIAMLNGLREDRYCEIDCLYYSGLGHYRLDNLLESRRCLERLLEASPNCRAAISLLDVVEDRIVKDGTVGIAITCAILGTAAALSAILLRQR